MKKLLVLTLALLPLTNAMASFAQKVTACVTVQGNVSAHHFQTGFGSTDYFDRGKFSAKVFNGMSCVSHTYKHGPKNLSVGVGDSNDPQVLLIRPDTSCANVYNPYSGWVTTPYLKTSEPEQSWLFTLTQSAPTGVYETVFDMKCERKGK